MGLLGSLLKATVKTALTPIAVVKDVVDVANGDTPVSTATLIGGAVNDIADGIDSLI